MALTHIAAYEVERELGTGAMGTVYLVRKGAEHLALKVIRPDLVGDPECLERFRREAELGSRVVHPNVVRTLGSGTAEVDGRPLHYLAMEHVQGRDLRAWLEDLGTVPEALLREIAVQVAAGLEAIHAAGAVHRDLKPENVMITETNEVRIMDLGVARLRDATVALTQADRFTGTLLYAAPEQVVEGEVGPAADLYALGVMLYELATGANPFQRGSPLAVMRAHAEFVPLPACEVQPAVSPFLSDVAATLMEKRADARFASAADLRLVLLDGERSTWWSNHAPHWSRRERRTPRLPVDRATAAYGRDAELSALREAWGDAQRGDGGVALVEGEPGIGKTRLLSELVQSLGAGPYHVLYGAFTPDGGVGGIARAVTAHLGDGDLVARLAPHLEAFEPLVPAFAAFLREETPPSGAPGLPPDAVPTLACRLLQSLAEDAPVLWLVDDVDLARQDGVRLVLALARAAERRRVLLVATCRDGGLPEGQGAAIEALPHLRRLRLTRLGARDVVLLLTEALRSEILAESLGGKVAYESDGVPLFVLEMLRALDQGGVVRRQADGSFVQARRLTTFPVPSGAHGIVTARLREIADDDRELLEAACVQGVEFDAGVVARLLDLKPVHVLRRLAVLERRGGLVRAEGTRHRFDQMLVQEALYQGLPPGLRQEYHTLVAEDLERGRGAPAEARDAWTLARHHLKGVRPREALRWLDTAFGWLESVGRSEEFLDLAEDALARPGLLEGRARAEVVLRLAAALASGAGLEEAQAAARDARTLAEAAGDPGLRARACFLEARLHVMAGDPAAAGEGFALARGLAHAAGDEELEARATGSLGVILDNTGRHAEGLPLLERHLEVARRRGDRKSEMIAACNLGLLLRHLGRSAESQAMMDLHLKIAQEVGDLRSEAVACGNLAILAADQGRIEDACRQHERNIQLARQTGSRRSEAIACGNLANEFVELGRIDRALALLEQGRALLHELGDVPSEGSAERNLGAALWKVGRFEDALVHYDRAIPLLARARDRRAEVGAAMDRGRVLARLGRRDEARSAFEAARALAHERSLPEEEAQALLDLSQWHRDAGDAGSAVRQAEEAATVLGDAAATPLAAKVALFRASFPGGDAARAVEVFLRVEASVPMPLRAEHYRRIGELTGDVRHLAKARGLIEAWLANLSPALRAGIEDRVPGYRAVRSGTR